VELSARHTRAYRLAAETDENHPQRRANLRLIRQVSMATQLRAYLLRRARYPAVPPPGRSLIRGESAHVFAWLPSRC